MTTRLTIEDEDIGERLDVFVANLPETPSRSQIKNAITRGEITVNGDVRKAGYALREGDLIEIDIQPPAPLKAIPQALPLDVLHEDDRLLVVNKASGMVVHPAPGHPDGTLVNAILAHCGADIERREGSIRPGIVHRLDRDTSGVMVVAKDLDALNALAVQFSARTIRRGYQALCHGPGLSDGGTIETLHGRHPRDRKRFTGRVERGRRAVTHYTVEARYRAGAIQVRCRLETGRTHQIRMHLSEAGAPLLGDPIYGGRAARECRLIERTALHAYELGFTHPDGEEMHFTSAPPGDYRAALEALERGARWRR